MFPTAPAAERTNGSGDTIFLCICHLSMLQPVKTAPSRSVSHQHTGAAGIRRPKRRFWNPSGHCSQVAPGPTCGQVVSPGLRRTPLSHCWATGLNRGQPSSLVSRLPRELSGGGSGERAGQQHPISSHQEGRPCFPLCLPRAQYAQAELPPSACRTPPAPRCLGAPDDWPSLPHPSKSSLLRDMVPKAGFIPGPGSHLCVSHLPPQAVLLFIQIPQGEILETPSRRRCSLGGSQSRQGG